MTMSTNTRDNNPTAYWLGVMTIMGATFLALSVIIGIIRPDYNDYTSEADGVVSRVEAKKRRGKSTSYITYVRFTDSDHQTFTARSIVNGSWRRHNEGDAVTVHYDPRDPQGGCLIVGDEDKLGEFNAFTAICRYGGGALLVVSIAARIILRFRP